MTSPLVTIIIPTYNRLDSLRQTVESVRRQRYPAVELIVVDDGSTDGTAEWLNASGIRVLQTGGRRGPSRARNLGIGEAAGEYVWFLDSDVILPDEELIARMVAQFSSRPETGSLGGEIVMHENDHDRAYGRQVLWNASNVRVTAERGKDGLVPCDYLATCNCFTKREYLARIGGFDERFVFGAEDMDLGVRLKQLGLANYLCFDLSVHHFHARTGRYEGETARYQHTRVQFARKHYRIPRLLLMFGADLVSSISFYLLLTPKLAVMAMQRRRITRQNLAGGWYLLRPYLKPTL